MDFPFHLVTGRTVRSIIDADRTGCIRVVREAYLLHGSGRSANPVSSFLTFPDRLGCRIIALPAYLGGSYAMSGVKWIASYPENIRRGFPRASAVLILNDHETGYPIACLEASIISAGRTAASAALAAEVLRGGDKRVGTASFIGTGLIARHVYEFLVASGWTVEDIVLYDIDAGEAARFAAEVGATGRHRSVRIADDAAGALRAGELVTLATVAAEPHVADPQLLAHNPLVLHLSLRDLSPEIILAGCNIVDDVDHVMSAGTSLHLAEQRHGRNFVTGTLAQVMSGAVAPIRQRPIIFSPFGLGVLDVAVGTWVYRHALAHSDAIAIDDFFGDLSR